jgi:hypothetical protein
MSSGVFEDVNYQLDNGTIMTCRVQPETKALVIDGTTNTPPTGTPTAGLGTVRISGGNRQIGIKARSITIKFTAEKTGYKDGSSIRLPIFDPAVWEDIAKGQVGTYLGTACVVTSSPKPEIRN